MAEECCCRAWLGTTSATSTPAHRPSPIKVAKRPRTITPQPRQSRPIPGRAEPCSAARPTAHPCVQGQGARVHETPTHHHPQPRQSRPIPGRAEPRSAAVPNRPAISPRAGCTGSRNAHPPSPQPRQSQPIPGRAEPCSAAFPNPAPPTGLTATPLRCPRRLVARFFLRGDLALDPLVHHPSRPLGAAALQGVLGIEYPVQRPHHQQHQ